MNLRLLCKVNGLLALLIAGAMAASEGISYAFGFDPQSAPYRPLLVASVISVVFGGALIMIGRTAKLELSRREAIAIVGTGWILSCFLGALPYALDAPGLSPVDAWFESVSGFTTTGSTVIEDLNVMSRSLLFWRSLTQWLGGLGIVVLFVALLSYLGVGSKALFRQESSAFMGRDLKARVQEVAMRLWTLYVVLSAVCALGLWALGLPPYQALTHAFTAISTGGFSTENRSIAAFDSVLVELWLVVFMMLGSISFLLYGRAIQLRRPLWLRDHETRAFVVVVSVACALVALDLYFLTERGGVQAVRQSVFQVVTIITTTGYATDDFNQWPPFSEIVLLALMAIGGCTGSTSGGLKLARWLVFLKMGRQQVIKAFRPSHVVPIKLNGVPLDADFRSQTLFLICLSGVTVFVGSGVVSLLEPSLDMDSSLSAALACLFNIGPGVGRVGPTENFGFLGPLTKLFLSWLMLLGRLEFFAVLALFVPDFWRRY